MPAFGEEMGVGDLNDFWDMVNLNLSLAFVVPDLATSLIKSQPNTTWFGGYLLFIIKLCQRGLSLLHGFHFPFFINEKKKGVA